MVKKAVRTKKFGGIYEKTSVFGGFCRYFAVDYAAFGGTET